MHDDHEDARQHHDMGGEDAGPVAPSTHEIEPWEKRIEAMVRLLSLADPQIVTIDELRRGIEELPPETYDGTTYYEKWIASLTAILIEKGVLDADELAARTAAVTARKTEAGGTGAGAVLEKSA